MGVFIILFHSLFILKIFIDSLWKCLKHREHKEETLLYFFLKFLFIIVVLGVHCDIYESSYNIS
jgi:hypothetical protein